MKYAQNIIRQRDCGSTYYVDTFALKNKITIMICCLYDKTARSNYATAKVDQENMPHGSNCRQTAAAIIFREE